MAKLSNLDYTQSVESYEEPISIGSLVSCLFEMRDNMHIQHFKTTSYAAHMALDTLYKDIVDLVDSLVESACAEDVTGLKLCAEAADA